MAHVTRDERGAVYVEFLLAFLPLFVLFLALCQVSLLIAGKLVVRHAAMTGARSAIVVLDDDPRFYAGQARGSLSPARRDEPSGPFAVLASLTGTKQEPEGEATFARQSGARMDVIRRAALRPLLVLAPSAESLFNARAATLADAVTRDAQQAAEFAQVYAEGAAVVTLHGAPRSQELVTEPVRDNQTVTVRVTFLQVCGVPLVRGLMCRSLGSMLDANDGALRERLKDARFPRLLEAIADPSNRFVAFEAEETLPNQGARYEYQGTEGENDAQAAN